MSLRALLLLSISFCVALASQAQTCTTLGQTPGSAFPVCGGTTFSQTTVPPCGGTTVPVPAPCTGLGYTDVNPFWYRFTCYGTGTFGFTITPLNIADDYDWQIYDITGRSPNDVYTDVSLVVGCNWSGLTGITGASATGTGLFNCGGVGWPLFSAMPTLIAGHEYIMLVSNFSPSQQGYQLNLTGGTANIVNPTTLPSLTGSRTDCGGQRVNILLNKKVLCNSLAPNGSDFILNPAVATIVSATGYGCTSAFDLDSVQITFSTPLPPGNYTITSRIGNDGNTLIDNCTNAMPVAVSVPFVVPVRPPLPMGTVSVGACVGSSIQVTFADDILCSSVTFSGAEFVITGPAPVTVTSVGPVNCTDANTFIINLAAPITTPGNYQLQMATGPDGNTVLGPCNREVPVGSVAPFTIQAQVPLPMGTVTPPPCMPNSIAVTFPDNFLCSSLAADGSDFTITGPSGVTVIGATAGCTSGETNTIALQLSSPIMVSGNYQVQVNTGSDGNTLTNSCGRTVTAGSTASFTLAPQPPLPMGTVASPGCSPSTLTLNFPEIVYCGTLAGDGSDFTITGPSAVTITGASPVCNAMGEVNSITLQLAGPITTSGNYIITIGNGIDGNTLIGACGRAITVGDNTPFTIPVAPSAIMNPVAALTCAPATIRVNLSEPVQCGSIAANGSDFVITGPAAVTVSGATGVNCSNGITSAIDIQLASPVVVGGNYQLQLLAGSDGNTLLSQCNRLSAPASISFAANDTVSARFTYQVQSTCTTSDISFNHPGGNGINSWSWVVDGSQGPAQSSFTQTFPGTGQYTVGLTVSNGVCTNTHSETITLANRITIDFAMPDAICPEDSIRFENMSTGPVNNWLWNFGNNQTSTLQNPSLQRYPATGADALYNITLTGFNTTNGCQQSKTKTLKVRATCLIAVPSGFTPNNDGKNDFFYPLNAFKAEKIDFRVFNRWGQLLFHSRDWTKKWDGRLGGVEQPSDVYVWIFRYTETDTKKEVTMRGTVTLIR
jgi:gliding motility-associated-like protein